ncbi:hypothetical protein, partial [Bradyrhizobium sp. I1.7.5]|uniref:hypothetical protein n=1 Tax=Bradyrhizobium sp. I1.7.5 TaxID=3156363 RepID=UPI0033948E89
FKLRHKPISNQRSIIPRSTPSMEGGTETALTPHLCKRFVHSPSRRQTSRCDISRHGVALLCGISTRAYRLKVGNADLFRKFNRTRDIPLKAKEIMQIGGSIRDKCGIKMRAMPVATTVKSDLGATEAATAVSINSALRPPPSGRCPRPFVATCDDSFSVILIHFATCSSRSSVTGSDVSYLIHAGPSPTSPDDA